MKGGIMTAAAATVTALFRDRPLAPQVAERLTAAEARAADLTRQIAALSLDEVLGEAGVAAKRQALEKELANATAEVERLRQAHRQAVVRDQRAEAGEQAKALRVELAEFERIADARVAAMADLCKHIELATRAYHRFIDATVALQLNLPAGCKPPAGSAEAFGPATVAVKAEMWRHGRGEVGSPYFALPGAGAPNLMVANAPERIESAESVVRGFNEFLIGSIRRQVETSIEFATEQVEAA